MSELKPRNPAPIVGSKFWSSSSMSPWSQTVSHYHGSRIIDQQYKWDTDVPSGITKIPGFDSGSIAHMTITFVKFPSGEIIDVHDHYFAGGVALEHVRKGFKNGVVSCWRTAHKIAHTFPAYTTIDMNTILDPFVDDQSQYFSPYDYAEIMFSDLKSASLKVHMRRGTPKRTTFVRADVLFGSDGQVTGCDCIISRRANHYAMRTRTSADGSMFIKRLEHLDPDFIGGRFVLFSATSNTDYQKKLRKLGLIAEAPNPNVSASNEYSDSAIEGKSTRRHAWTPDEEAYIEEHPDMTARELAAKFGVTLRAIERRRAVIRKRANSAK